ncbi:hypothetical protein V6N13_052522 [Hibiscus sabdariffa]
MVVVLCNRFYCWIKLSLQKKGISLKDWKKAVDGKLANEHNEKVHRPLRPQILKRRLLMAHLHAFLYETYAPVTLNEYAIVMTY